MSALEQLLRVPEKTAAAVATQEPVKLAGSFWQEFLRVECDKFLLLLLIIFLWKVGQLEMMKYVVGGLIVAINHNRFRWN